MVVSLVLLAGIFSLVGILPPGWTIYFITFISILFLLQTRSAARYTWITPTIICICSILFSLVVGDLLLRLVLRDSLFYRPHDRLVEVSPVYVNAFRYSPNVHIRQRSWGDLANLSCDYKLQERRQVEFATDEYGFRNSHWDRTSAVELLVLGDSFGVGQGTTQEKTWWRILSQRMSKTLYNFSFPAAPKEEVAILNREISRLKLSRDSLLLWFIFEGNDLDDETRTNGFQPIMRSGFDAILTRLGTYQNRSPLRLLGRSIFSRCDTRDLVTQRELPGHKNVLFLKSYDSSLHTTSREIKNRVGWKNLQIAFIKLKELSLQYGFNVLVVNVPTKAQVYLQKNTEGIDSSLAQLLREQSEKNDFLFMNLLDTLSEVAANPSNELLYWRDDSHWNEFGNEIVASRVQKFLTELHSNNKTDS